MVALINMLGTKWHRLTPVELLPTLPDQDTTGAWWRCECDCGKFTVVRGKCLRNGHVKSCGCLSNEARRLKSAKQREIARLCRLARAQNSIQIGLLDAAIANGISFTPPFQSG